MAATGLVAPSLSKVTLTVDCQIPSRTSLRSERTTRARTELSTGTVLMNLT